MAAVTRDQFNAKLARLLSQIDGENADFDDFDRILGTEGTERISEDVVAIEELISKQIGPVFDEVPRSPAMLSCFMYGVMIGQKLAKFGVLGVTADDK